MDLRLITLLATAALAVASGTASAQSTKPLGKFGAWEGYAYSEGGDKVCYAAAQADKTQGGDKGRMPTGIAITHRPKSPGEVSVSAPYGLKKGGEVEVQVGAMKHGFIIQGTAAWAKDAAADKALVAGMLKGKDLQVRATPAKGQPVTDSIPLKGFPEALAAIDKACGVKR